MATWYVDNVGGNDANSGASEALAKASIGALRNITMANGDIVRVKSTGTTYTVIGPTGASVVALCSTNGGTTAAAVMFTNYATDTTRPTIQFDKDLVNAGYWSMSYFYVKNINFIFDSKTSTETAMQLFTLNVFGTTGRNGLIKDCNFNFIRTGGSTTYKTYTMNYLSLENCILDFNWDNYNFTSTFSTTETKTYKCRFLKSAANSVSGNFSIYGSVFKCIFEVKNTATNGVIFTTGGGTQSNYNNNTIILPSNGASNTFFLFTRQTSANLYANHPAFFSNIVRNLNTTATINLYGATTSTTPPAGSALKFGNNALYGITNKWANLTLTNFSNAEDIQQFGVDIVLSGSPFLSEDSTNADFCKIDTSAADGIACQGVALYDPEVDLGALQSIATGGGAVPNAYDLRAGVTVGAVTGTLVIPAITDVKIGVNYDVAPNAKTGTYDGSDRWSDAGESNVRSGTAYKANSLTNNKTGTLDLPSVNDVRSGTQFDNTTKTGLLDLPNVADVKLGVTFDQTTKTGTLESTDPGEANVLSGINYKINSVSKTGTKIFYSLLALNVVKIGTDRGDGQLGTYDGSDRYTDPLESNVLNGVTYTYNNVLKTGSAMSYPLLAVNLVKIGVDRGDGQTGTYDGSDRYTDLDLSNIKSSYSFRYNSLTDNRTGTHTEAISSDPGVANVRAGTNYTINNVSKTGTLDLPNISDVRFGTQFDNLSKTGLLDLPNVNKVDLGTVFDNNTKTGTMETTDPLESNVLAGVTYKIKSVSKTGTKPFYALLPLNNVEFGIDRGDGQLGTNKGENFNTALLANQIKVDEVIENLGNTIVGTYDANERYTNLSENEVKLGTTYLYNNISKTGTLSGGAADYPLESKVLYPTQYAFGTKQGTLGQYNTNNLNIAEQINNNAKLIITNVLGNTWSELKYFKEVEKNDFYNNAKGYGIRPLDDERTFDIIGKETIDLKFEIKLTNDFQNRDGDDIERQTELDLITKMEEIRRQLRITKFGNFNNIRIVKTFVRPEINKLDNSNVLVCQAEIVVSYSI